MDRYQQEEKDALAYGFAKSTYAGRPAGAALPTILR